MANKSCFKANEEILFNNGFHHEPWGDYQNLYKNEDIKIIVGEHGDSTAYPSKFTFNIHLEILTNEDIELIKNQNQ